MHILFTLFSFPSPYHPIPIQFNSIQFNPNVSFICLVNLRLCALRCMQPVFSNFSPLKHAACECVDNSLHSNKHWEKKSKRPYISLTSLHNLKCNNVLFSLNNRRSQFGVHVSLFSFTFYFYFFSNFFFIFKLIWRFYQTKNACMRVCLCFACSSGVIGWMWMVCVYSST